MNPGQFKCVTRETGYHVSIRELLIQNLQNQIAELVRRPRIMLKIIYFSGGHQFFQTSPGIKSLYDRGRKFYFFISRGVIIWDRGSNFRKFIDQGSHRAHLTEALGQDAACIYRQQSHRFLLRTPLKTRVKPQKQPLELSCKNRICVALESRF